MPASLRELRARKASVQATKKITRAMELIAASRIVKAQQRANHAGPYTRELTRAVSAVATYSDIEHPLTTEVPDPKRVAMLLITSDRGLAGAYSANAIRTGESLMENLRADGIEVRPYLCGRKGIQYYQFRGREVADSWEGFSESPEYRHADMIADELLDAFVTPTSEGGVDAIHIVYTHFHSMLNQEVQVVRLLPLEIVDAEEGHPSHGEVLPVYAFEPSAQDVLNTLLPLYVRNRIHYALLQAAASELAARQRAMKSATDNASDLIDSLTRQANQARQAQITQEISEIVGGAGALAEANASEG